MVTDCVVLVFPPWGLGAGCGFTVFWIVEGFLGMGFVRPTTAFQR